MTEQLRNLQIRRSKIIVKKEVIYENYAYFYVYNNRVFVSDKLLRATLEKKFSKN